MAEFNLTDYHTLIELAKQHDPKGNTATLIDLLAKKNPLLEEGHWEEANDLNSHEFTQIISEPSGVWTRINKAVPFESGVTKQVTEKLYNLSSLSKIPIKLIKKARNSEKYLANNNKMHVRGMGKTAHNALFYGNNKVNPDQPHGLFTRYNSLSDVNVLNGGGSGSDVTSIAIVKWGIDGVYFTYPRGSKKLIVEGMPKTEFIQEDGGGYYAKITPFDLDIGLNVANSNNFWRIANFEISGSSNLFNDDLLIEVLNEIGDLENCVIYVNKKIKTQMDIALKDKTNVNLSIDEAWGRPVTHFLQTPVKVCEGILSTETAVV